MVFFSSTKDIIFSLKTDPSARFLVLSNLLTMVFAIVLQWSVFEVMLVYWTQSVIIGFFAVLKIIVSGVYTKNLLFLFLAPFFVVHYGMFHFVYLLFLGMFLVSVDPTKLTPLFFLGIILAAIPFFINHLISFIIRFDEIKKADPNKFFTAPYQRIFPMHISIIFAGWVMMLSGMNVIILLLFMILKTVADVLMHAQEHL